MNHGLKGRGNEVKESKTERVKKEKERKSEGLRVSEDMRLK